MEATGQYWDSAQTDEIFIRSTLPVESTGDQVPADGGPPEFIKMHVDGNTRIRGNLYIQDNAGGMVNVYDTLMEAMVSGGGGGSYSGGDSGSGSGSDSESSSGPPLEGQILEYITGTLRGQTITGYAGQQYTLNEFTGGDPNQYYYGVIYSDWTTLPFSEFLYVPPNNTRQVIYKFSFCILFGNPRSEIKENRYSKVMSTKYLNFV